MPTIDTSGRFGAEVVIEGLDAVLNGLEEVDPKLRKKLDRDLRSVVDTVAETARRQVDSRTEETAKGYKVTHRAGVYKITNRTHSAAILEHAAIGHTPQGESLVATLNEKYGRPGRILWESWDIMAPWVTDRVRSIVEAAEFELERLMS